MPVWLTRTKFTALSPIDDDPSVHLVYLDSVVGMTGADVAAQLAAAWTTAGIGATNAPTKYLAESISRASNSASVEVYDITAHLAGTAAGAPVGMHTFTPDGPESATSYPAGVAATVSFRADYGSAVEFGPGTRPRSRLRNRFYFGPLTGGAFTLEATTNRCKFSDQFRNDMNLWLTTKAQLLTTADAATKLQVWSRVSADTIDPAQSWMDDRPDYQRRRSDPNPSSRGYFTFA